MTPDREQRIRERAYRLWEQEGCPDGREHEHWHQAASEVASEDSLADSDGAAALSTSAETRASGFDGQTKRRASPARRRVAKAAEAEGHGAPH